VKDLRFNKASLGEVVMEVWGGGECVSEGGGSRKVWHFGRWVED